MLRSIIATVSIFIAALFAVPVSAQDVELNGAVQVVRTIDDNGTTREELQAPDRVVPGDRLVFTTHYRNTSAEAADDFVVTNPLPAAVALAEDGDFQVSVDGGQTFGTLAALTVGDGDAAPRPATLSDVTHIRWTLARIEPGKEGELKYFAVVR